LRDDPSWSRQRILATVAKGTAQVVPLPTTIPVYVLYWTAWVSEGGVVHFRKDIYERDKELDKALLQAFPALKEMETWQWP
jgi:murein L,D-transpeptidase YcbB/YkuD